MANITPVITRVEDERGQPVGWTAQWATMHNGDVGLPVNFPQMSDRSVQVTGTFGTGGTATIQGSIDGTNYATLTNPQGTTLTVTAAGISQITEAVPNFRPNITAGDGTTSLTVTAFFRRLWFP